MALTNCARCGHLVSTKAPRCPGCGTPPSENPTTSVSSSAESHGKERAAKSASSRSSGSAGGRRAGIKGSRLSIDLSNWKLLLGVGVLIVFGWWWFAYLPGTPSYAIWSFDHNLRNRNGAAAAQFIDFKKLTRNVMMRGMERKAAAAKSPDEKRRLLLGETIGGGLIDMFSGPLAHIARVRFEKKVEQSKGSPFGVIDLLDAWVDMRWTSNNTAVTRVYDQHGKAIDVTLTCEEGNWRITDLSGPAIRDQYHKLKKERPGLHVPSTPSPSGPNQSHRQPSV